jgi:hypothetical protein
VENGLTPNTSTEWDYILEIDKASSVDDTGDWRIVGVLSGPDYVDAEDMEMSEEALNKVVERINEAPIPLKDWHAKNTIMSEMGEVYKAWRSDEGLVMVEAMLDKDHPSSGWLLRKIEKGKKFGLSVGGRAAHNIIEKAGRKIIQLLDVIPSEVSLTTKPFFQPSFGTVIRKAIDEAEAESVEKGDKSSMSNEKDTPKAVDVEVKVNNPVPDVGTQDGDPASEGAQPADTNPPLDNSVSQVPAPQVVEKSQQSEAILALTETIRTVVREELSALSAKDAAPAAASQPTEEPVEKSEDDKFAVLEKALADTRAQLELVKENIPGVKEPGVLISKSEAEQLAETLNAMDPRERLLFGLRASHKE